MEGDERAAADGNWRGCAGHHVVIAAAVIGVFVADGADGGEFVGDLGEFGDHFTEVKAGDGGFDGFQIAANIGGGVGFGIETFVVTWAAIEPDEDAVDVGG